MTRAKRVRKPRVADTASVHPKTVTAVSQGAVEAPRRTRGTIRPGYPAKVRRRAHSGLAWDVALELAGGDARRLDVVSATEVVVRNHPVR